MGLRGVVNGLAALAFYVFAVAFLLGRSGEWALVWLRFPETPQVALALLAGNFLAPRLLGVKLPSLGFQLLLFMTLVYYFFDVRSAARSFPPAQLSGKVAVVTGGNSGIGKATAIALAERNATVVIACRNDRKCARAAADITQQSGGAGKVVPLRLDLSDLATVDYFSLMLARKFPRVDILVNNAGYSPPHARSERPTSQGLEQSFGSMHMAHFALTEWVIRRNEGGAKGLVVHNVASGMHHFCQLFTGLKGLTGGGWEDACLPKKFLESGFKEVGPKGYSPFKHFPIFLRKHFDLRYHRAKLANVLHASELAKRYKGIYATASDLGFVSSSITPLHRALGANLGSFEFSLDQFIWRKALPHGIRPVLLGAVLPFVKPWAKDQGISTAKNGAIVDNLGDVIYPFTLEKAVGMKDVGSQKKAAKKLYDASAKVLEEFEASRGGSMDEQQD